MRLRPCKARETHFEPPDTGAGSVEVHVPEDTAAGFINNRRSNWRFAFNGVLDRDTSQEECFERVAQPVINSVMEGYNGTIFAYGQTGSGKTFTLTGGVSAYSDRGIIPRTLSEVFRLRQCTWPALVDENLAEPHLLARCIDENLLARCIGGDDEL